MTETDRKEYELALKQAKKRFGSNCEHKTTRGGVCINCLRKVVVRRRT